MEAEILNEPCDCDNDKPKGKVTISINPPPSDRRCECCGKHISELKPFGKAGDPLVGDFDGTLLLKNFRAMTYHHEELDVKIQAVMDELKAEGKEDFSEYEDKLIKKYGAEEAQGLMDYDQIVNTVSASWECRDCILLDNKEYHTKQGETYG